MKLLITYPELEQIISDKLNQNIGLQYAGNQTVKLTLHTSIKKIVTINVDLSAELKLSVYGNDLYIDYNVLPNENKISGRLSGLIDAVAPNMVNVILNYLTNKYPQYNDIVEKVPNADRLRVHLAAIPQLKSMLQHVVIESIIPQEEGIRIDAKMKY